MPKKKNDCAHDLLVATNPFSIHRKSYALKWALLVAVVVCAMLAVGMFWLNSLGH